MKKAILFITFAILFVCAPASHAALVIEDASGDAIGINGLIVGGNLFNVDFAFGIYNDIFGAGQPATFFGRPDLAEEAANAINLALEGSGGPSEGYVDYCRIADGGTTKTSYFIPYEFTSSTNSIVRGVKGDLVFGKDWRILSTQSSEIAGSGSGEMFAASFTPVPLPAAVWLLGSGLLGIVGIRRKMMHI